ncbi:unnamed protein product [Rhizoctonia solani]|uniref:Jacalin-type lectin domain-containing protein n=1 Tax=Rhizoctonia solani TaxID=456999 RepID=A0A8H3DD29_9AGAM|nr:unnamed protein product [Rhizoctonia solani]CAE6522956.1 unnamed protein product [Rhizoctonia solani]
MAQLILAATTAAALAPHAAEVVNLATTVSQAVSVFTKSLKTARDRHHEAQDIGFQASPTWMRKAEERTRIYYEQGPSGPVSWVFTHGTEIPQNALVCGEDIDGSPLYVCRTFHRGGVHFGKAGRGFKTGAMFGYDCKELEIEFYEVLVAEESAVRWETATYPFIVRKYGGGTLVEGGHEHDGSPLFIARAFYWGGTHPGKTSSVLKGADITFAGKEYCLKDYQVLVLSDPGYASIAALDLD